MAKQKEPADLPLLENWRNWNEEPEGAINEYPFFVDVHVTGDRSSAGPYTFINTIAKPKTLGISVPGIVFRYVESREAKRPEINLKTDTGSYHGGWLVDEAAALASLLMCARVEPGGLSRTFDHSMTNDPLGRPLALEDVRTPTFHPRSSNVIVPVALGSRQLGSLDELQLVFNLTRNQLVAFVRGARLFQDALWLAEQEPQLSWLMLVSALEGAANAWKSEKGSASDRLKFAKPDLVSRLEQDGGKELVDYVAAAIVDTLGSTRKFVEFCVEFLPAEPPRRPSEAFRIPWTIDFWSKALKQIYGYRSKALHEGIPFPAPMCEHPFIEAPGAPPCERGTIGLAVRAMGASWKAEDLPVNLNLFVQFTQAVLVNWLRHAGARPTPAHSSKKVQLFRWLIGVLKRLIPLTKDFRTN